MKSHQNATFFFVKYLNQFKHLDNRRSFIKCHRLNVLHIFLLFDGTRLENNLEKTNFYENPGAEYAQPSW